MDDSWFGGFVRSLMWSPKTSSQSGAKKTNKEISYRCLLFQANPYNSSQPIRIDQAVNAHTTRAPGRRRLPSVLSYPAHGLCPTVGDLRSPALGWRPPAQELCPTSVPPRFARHHPVTEWHGGCSFRRRAGILWKWSPCDRALPPGSGRKLTYPPSTSGLVVTSPRCPAQASIRIKTMSQPQANAMMTWSCSMAGAGQRQLPSPPQ